MNIQASTGLRSLYCLALLSAVFSSSGFGVSGWVLLTTAGGWLPKGMLIFAVLAALYRMAMVVKEKNTLNAVGATGFLAVLRKIGLFMMALGVIGSLVIIFTKPLALGIFGQPGEAGVAFYVVGTFAFLVASLGMPGIVVFEASRLFGFERAYRAAT
jgi:hypothetical protein